MRSDKLQNAIGGIDLDLIARSELPVKKKKGYKIVSVIAAVLALAIGFGIFAGTSGQPGYSVYAGDMLAVYPTMAPYVEYLVDREGYDAWRADQKKKWEYYGESDEGLEDFIALTAGEFLSADGENLVYSPLNLYIALSMLAETADGNTRKQLLNLLGANDIENLRKRVNALWNANYNDDGLTSSILANSLWLNEKCSFYKETLEILRDSYYASSYQGKMGSASFDKALRNWLNDHTGGLLSDQIDEIKLSPNTVLALVTTVYFQASWREEFQEATKKDVFHGVGGDTQADFMYQSYTDLYYQGKEFSAVSKNLEGSGTMWFMLPDEGVSVNDLLQDEEVLSFISTIDAWQASKEVMIRLSVPKFEVSSKLDLEGSLKKLGVTDCFDENRADFSRLTSGNAYVGKLEHGAFVGIDEKGVTASAYTFTQLYGTSSTQPTVTFTVDRPFLFMIAGEDGSVLFIGAVNRI